MLNERLILAAFKEGDECVKLLQQIRPRLERKMVYHALFITFTVFCWVTAAPIREWPAFIAAAILSFALYIWVRDYLRIINTLIANRDSIENWHQTKMRVLTSSEYA